jgi:hypothetical protein
MHHTHVPDHLEVILSRLHGAKKCGEGWSAHCPAHEDRRASLSIGLGDGGKVLLHCHAGCTVQSIVTAIGLHMRDLHPAPDGRASTTGTCRVVATYDYRDEQAQMLYQVVRYEPKDFRQRRPDGKGGWVWSLASVRRVLYRLPEITRAVADGRVVFVVEGEKDAERLAGLGLHATTNAGGASKWRSEYSDQLRGAQVVILPDNDNPGRKHAQQVAQSLHGKAASIKVIELPGLPPKGDVSDWTAAGGTKQKLLELCDQAPPWEPQEATETNDGEKPRHCAEGLRYSAGALTLIVSKQKTRWQVAVLRGPDALGAAILHLADIRGRRDLLNSLQSVEPAERDALEKLLLRLATVAERDWQEHLSRLGKQLRAAEQEQLQQEAAAETVARKERLRQIEPIAAAVLGNPALLHRIVQAVAARGVVAEEANALILYLALFSQVTGSPISIVLKGDSAGGKSFLVQQIVSLCPEGCHIPFTSMSERALIYDNRSYSHQTIIIFEVHGQGGEFANYIARSLASEGCIRHQTVEKTPHGLVPREIVKQGPTNFVTTTTLPEMHPENETRIWTLLVDDSALTTKGVLEIQAKRASGAFKPADTTDLRSAFEWLKATGATEATVAYAELLSQAMPGKPLRLRRDFHRLLQLIQVSALLHQLQRQRDPAGRVVATLADYAMVRALVLPTFARTIAGLTEKTTELVEALESVLEEKIMNGTKREDARASYSDLVKETGKPKYYITRWLQPALANGQVDNTNAGERGRPAALKTGHYKLDDGDVLPTVRELAGQLNCNVEWIDPLTGQRQVVQVLQSACNTTPPCGGMSQTVNGQQVGTSTTPGDQGVAALRLGDTTQISPPSSTPPPPAEKILALPPAATLQHCNTGTGSAAEVKVEQGITADRLGADQCSTPTATPCNTQDERAATGADEGGWDEA